MFRPLVVGFLPLLFIILLASLGLMAGALDFALYLAVTAFGMAVAAAALWSQELKTMPKLRIALFQRGQDLERIEAALEYPSRWATYSVALFFASGFLFGAYYLLPPEVSVAEAQPTFVLAFYTFVLAIAYFMLLFICAVRSRSAWAFDLGITISGALWFGVLFLPTLFAMEGEAIPITFLGAAVLGTFQAGLASIPPFLLVLSVSEVLGLVGCVLIIWQNLSYMRHRRLKFSNRTTGVSVILYLLPFIGYAIFLVLTPAKPTVEVICQQLSTHTQIFIHASTTQTIVGVNTSNQTLTQSIGQVECP